MLDSIALDSTRLQRLQQIPLWDFALALYAKPGVEAACLTLQEEAEIDVCELLFHCWLCSSGLEAIPAVLADEREQRRLWQCQVTEVLRGLRRDLKAQAGASEPVAALRETIKQAELMAERENLQRWQAWVCEASDIQQRVRNITENAPNTATWLRKQLFMPLSHAQLKSDSITPSTLFQALQTLTSQLDPYLVAR